MIGEFDLIRKLSKMMDGPSPGVYRSIGDDAAVLEPPPGRLLFSSDMMVEGIHFRLDFSEPWEVGWKALAVNVSDIAAMGGTPLYAVVSLGVGRQDRPVSFYEEIYRGLNKAARRYGLSVVGGDTVRTEGPLVLDVSILGFAVSPVLRSGARNGDLLAVTGCLGASCAGLQWFLTKKTRHGPPYVDKAVKAHQRPQPRVKEAQAAVATGAVTALIDISDGLAGDLGHICEESGLGATIEASCIPVDASASRIASQVGASPVEWALRGGEDYELLMTVDPARGSLAKTAVENLGTRLTFIGEMTDKMSGVALVESGKWTLVERGGYTHF